MQSIAAIATGIALVPGHEAEPPPDTRRQFALEVRDEPETLERVLGQLRRRRCRVTDVTYAAAWAPGLPAHLVLGIEAPAPRAHLVESWLTGIAAVESVERIGG